MTQFIEAVKHGLKGLEAVSTGLCSGCQECQNAYGFESQQDFQDAIKCEDAIDEGGFSWYECECCGSILGGDRYAAHGVDKDGKIVHLDICVDCLIFIANGDEPDNWDG